MRFCPAQFEDSLIRVAVMANSFDKLILADAVQFICRHQDLKQFLQSRF